MKKIVCSQELNLMNKNDTSVLIEIPPNVFRASKAYHVSDLHDSEQICSSYVMSSKQGSHIRVNFHYQLSHN